MGVYCSSLPLSLALLVSAGAGLNNGTRTITCAGSNHQMMREICTVQMNLEVDESLPTIFKIYLDYRTSRTGAWSISTVHATTLFSSYNSTPNLNLGV